MTESMTSGPSFEGERLERGLGRHHRPQPQFGRIIRADRGPHGLGAAPCMRSEQEGEQTPMQGAGG
jgi:hypothetical protein